MKFPSQTFFFLPDFPPKVKVLRLTPKPSSQVLDRAISTFWTFIPDPTEFPSRLKLGTGKTAALISPLTAYILKGWKKKRLLTSPVWVFNLLGSISVKGSLEAFFFFFLLVFAMFLSLLLISSASLAFSWWPVDIEGSPTDPSDLHKSSCFATGKLCSDICLISAHLHDKAATLPARTLAL